jgi:hypothetical protein
MNVVLLNTDSTPHYKVGDHVYYPAPNGRSYRATVTNVHTSAWLSGIEVKVNEGPFTGWVVLTHRGVLRLEEKNRMRMFRHFLIRTRLLLASARRRYLRTERRRRIEEKKCSLLYDELWEICDALPFSNDKRFLLFLIEYGLYNVRFLRRVLEYAKELAKEQKELTTTRATN